MACMHGINGMQNYRWKKLNGPWKALRVRLEIKECIALGMTLGIVRSVLLRSHLILLLEQTTGYRMGPPRERLTINRHIFVIDDVMN